MNLRWGETLSSPDIPACQYFRARRSLAPPVDGFMVPKQARSQRRFSLNRPMADGWELLARPGRLAYHRSMRPSQNPGWTIEEFCARYRNENVHTEQVTALALRLFDGLRSALGLDASERRLLEAAGRLHDIGYSVDPARHREVGAELVQSQGLRGFSSSEVAIVAGIMLLHSGDLRSVLEHPLLKRARSRKRVLRLGSFLRMADGLDFSHLQDAVITRIRIVSNGVEITVASDIFPANRNRADEKADLWRLVWRREIRFGAPRPGPTPAQPCLGPGTPLVEGARRLLWRQFKRMLMKSAGAVHGVETGPLHDLRVANRRLRFLLLIFRKHLPAVLVDEARAELGRLSRALGPARDVDAWIELLIRESRGLESGGRADWSGYLQTQIERRQEHQPVVRRSLEKASFRALKQKLACLLRIDLAQRRLSASEGSLENLAATALRRALHQVRAHRRWRHSRSAEKLHAFRIRLRRARYLAEFFAPVLGSVLQKLVRRLRQVEQRLGAIHDLDVALERLRHFRERPPPALVASLRKRRRRNLGHLDQPWK